MARTAGPTLIGALVILVTMPIALFAFQGMWRARMTRELSPPPVAVRRDEPAPKAITPPPEAPAPPKATLRPVDELLIGLLEGHDVPNGTNVMPDGPRVDLSAQRNGHLARVDLDRDGKWDEVWSIELDAITRYVSPLDNGEMTDRYSWMNGDWVPLSASPPPPGGAP